MRYRAENDKFQSIRLRSIAGLGLGWEVFKNDDGLLDLAVGSSYITEDLMDNQPDYGYVTRRPDCRFSGTNSTTA